MCKNIFTNENEFDLNGPITKDGVHYFGFGCSQHPTGFGHGRLFPPIIIPYIQQITTQMIYMVTITVDGVISYTISKLYIYILNLLLYYLYYNTS